MSRTVAWRRAVSDACNWHQTQALDATIYILRQTGPTGFLLKEEGETKTVRVFLGDPHTCTCPVFKRERDLCKHICWLLLRKFRLSVNDPLSWQLGLVEREVNEILRDRNTAEQSRPQRTKVQKKEKEVVDGRSVVEQREIADDDVCPICQDEFMAKKLPVTFCKFGCGNSVHIKCMSVWAEHQKKTSQAGTIKCPMCREDFGPLEMLKTESRNAGMQRPAPHGVRMDRHTGMICSNCHMAPIQGKCYKCTTCPTFMLCQRCFNFPIHTAHSFQFRQKRNQRWRAAVRTLGSSLPPAIVNDMMRRDISEEDYDVLLQLDRNNDGELSSLTEEAVQTIPLERVREGSHILAPGSQCRVCLRAFSPGQFVRRLPCRHKFHKECIDGWLLHSHPTCPIDGLVATSQPAPQRQETRSAPQDTVIPAQRPEAEGQLVISAMGIPMSALRATETTGHAPALRRPPRAARVPARNHVDLELSGLAVGTAPDNNTVENRTQMAHNLPGQRLFNQAGQHRQRIEQQLSSLNREMAASPQGEQLLTTGDLIHFLQSDSAESSRRGSGDASAQVDQRGNIVFPDLSQSSLQARRSSAGSQSSANDLDQKSRGRAARERLRRPGQHVGLLRERASSLDRNMPTIQAVAPGARELYLGNSPLTQPPVDERGNAGRAISGQMSRARLFKSVQRGPLTGRANRPSHRLNTNDIRLDGNAIDAGELENRE